MANRCQFIAVGKQLMFWNYYDCDWMPTLRLLHRFPLSMKYIQIDKGACKFLLQGA